MRLVSLLAALFLFAAAIAVLPSADAMQTPPPCYSTATSCCGIDPGFAPCCSPVTCPPSPHCSTPEGPVLATATALPLPRVTYTINPDCSVDVYETSSCPAGFQKSTLHYNAKAVEAWADTCVPMCACMPMSAVDLSDIDPFPTCVRECFPLPTDDCDLQDVYYTGPVGFPVDVWGGDCDIDVDPIGACAPPSGDSTERHIGPIHLRLLLCGGGVPDWS